MMSVDIWSPSLGGMLVISSPLLYDITRDFSICLPIHFMFCSFSTDLNLHVRTKYTIKSAYVRYYLLVFFVIAKSRFIQLQASLSLTVHW